MWVTGHLGIAISDRDVHWRRERSLSRGLCAAESQQSSAFIAPYSHPLYSVNRSGLRVYLGWWLGMWEAEPQVWLLEYQHHCGGFFFFFWKLNGVWVQEILHSFCSHRFIKANHGLSKLLTLCSWPFETRRGQKVFSHYLAENHLLPHSWKEWGFHFSGNIIEQGHYYNFSKATAKYSY